MRTEGPDPGEDAPRATSRLAGGASIAEGAKPLVALHRVPRVAVSWGTRDALAYNLMSMNPAMMLAIPLLAAFAYYSADSLGVAFLLAGVFCGAQAIVYAFLASSIPRSGGDYYFQSRLLSRTVGSVVGLACIVFGGALWMAIACWLAGNVVVGPALVIVGRLAGSSALEAGGVWVQTGSGMFCLSIGVIGWALLINLRSPSSYLRLQLVFWIVGCAAIVVPVLLSLLSPARAIVDSASFVAATGAARALGYGSDGRGATAGQVLALLAVAAFPLIYPAWSIHHVGEMKGASRLRSQVLTMLGAELITVVASAVVIWLLVSRIGASALAAGAFLFIDHRAGLPMPTLPVFWFFTGEIWPSGVAALCLVVFFNALFWMWVPDIPLAASRVLVGMARSRSLPSCLGRVSLRDGTPVAALLAFSLLSLAPAAAYSYTELWRLSMTVTLLNGLSFALTCILAALLPYLHRETYRYSTAAPFEVLRVPVVTILGCAFVTFIGVVAWRFTVDGRLSFGWSPLLAWALCAACYGLSIALVFGYGAYRRRHESLEVEVIYRVSSTAGSRSRASA
jgi:basic amino acid/polyamine antiporter, APA family